MLEDGITERSVGVEERMGNLIEEFYLGYWIAYLRRYFNLVLMHHELSQQRTKSAIAESLHECLVTFGPRLSDNVTWVHGRFEAMGIRLPERPVFPADYRRWMDAIHEGLPMSRSRNAAQFDTFLHGKQLGYIHAGLTELIQIPKLD